MTEIVTSTIRDFSKRTGLSRSYIYVLLDKGDLESVKIGATRLIIEESYARLIARSRVPPRSLRCAIAA
jgi:excisionase family DNA binding protein